MRYSKIALIGALFALLFFFTPPHWPHSQAQDGWDVWFASTSTSGEITTTSAIINSVTFDRYTDILRVVATTTAFFAFGPTNVDSDFATGEIHPVATLTTGVMLPANVPEYFWIGGGGFLAVRTSSGTGTVYITEMTR